jgi:repressor LexA
MNGMETTWITAAIGARLRKARMDRGMTQMELASHIQAEAPQIEFYERGEQYMPFDRLFDIAAILGIPVIDLLGE